MRHVGLDHPLVAMPVALGIGLLVWAAIVAGIITVVQR